MVIRGVLIGEIVGRRILPFLKREIVDLKTLILNIRVVFPNGEIIDVFAPCPIVASRFKFQTR